MEETGENHRPVQITDKLYLFNLVWLFLIPKTN
jgi:hypothetical protein